MDELTKRENYDYELVEKEEEEILVTNAAIKATDVFALIGAGAFAATGIVCLIDKLKQRRKAKKNKDEFTDDFKTILIQKMVQEGCGSEEINRVLKSFELYY